MIKLYDVNKNFLRMITNASGIEIVSELKTADRIIKFYVPGVNRDIINECYVEYGEVRYVIKEVNPHDWYVECVGKLDLEDLESDIIPKFVAEDVSVDVMADAVLPDGWQVITHLTKERSVQQFNKNRYELLMKIRDAFMCEIAIDNINKIVRFESSIGEDKGVYFRHDLNLKALDPSYDSYDFYTRIVPVGKDGLDITSVNGGKNYLENYQYSNKIRVFYWNDGSYDDAEDLKDDAALKLADMSKPKKRYSCKVIDLAKMYPEYSVLDYSLGDTIGISDANKDVYDAQKIIRMIEYPYEPERNSVDLSNTFWSWDDYQDRVQAALDAWDDITNQDGTVNGVYVHGITNGEGKTEIEVLINGNPTVQSAVKKAESAHSAASSAASSASSASSAANAAVAAANAAVTAANNKNRVYYQDSMPADDGISIGDVWFDIGDGNKMYGWNGSGWDARLFGGDAIAQLSITSAHISNLDAGKIVTGQLTSIAINNGNGTFSVDADGNLVAANADIIGKVVVQEGQVGGWKIDGTSLSKEFVYNGEKYGIQFFAPDGAPPWESGIRVKHYYKDKADSSFEMPFYVTYEGKLFSANAEISGNVTATAGKLGFLSVTPTSLYSDHWDFSKDHFRIALESEKTYLYMDSLTGIGERVIAAAQNKISLISPVMSIGKYDATSVGYDVTINGRTYMSDSLYVLGNISCSGTMYGSVKGNYYSNKWDTTGMYLDDNGNVHAGVGNGDANYWGVFGPDGSINHGLYWKSGSAFHVGNFFVGAKRGYGDGKVGTMITSAGYMHIQRSDGLPYIAFMYGTGNSSGNLWNSCTHYGDFGLDSDGWFSIEAGNSKGLRPTTTNKIALGSSNHRWTTVFSVNAFNASSDERMKNIISEVPDRYVDALLDMTPILYKWANDDEQKMHIGFGAQSAEQAMLDHGIKLNEVVGIVRPQSDSDQYSMAYTEILTITVSALKRMNKRINELEEALKGEIA